MMIDHMYAYERRGGKTARYGLSAFTMAMMVFTASGKVAGRQSTKGGRRISMTV